MGSQWNSGRYYAGILDIRLGEQLLFVVKAPEEAEARVLALADTVLRDGVQETEVRAVLEPALKNVVEIEEREGADDPPIADIWYPEPIIEDDEVEYTSPLHLRTVLLRAGLLRT
jgi:hypothetical protein